MYVFVRDVLPHVPGLLRVNESLINHSPHKTDFIGFRHALVDEAGREGDVGAGVSGVGQRFILVDEAPDRMSGVWSCILHDTLI